jgi:molybdopterin-guanine dinucleotide biosynthesis adapter protein
VGQRGVRVVGIAGYKNSGKTTLVAELLAEFGRRGLHVATIKHAHHDFDIDQPGKDSHVHRTAGAVEVIVSSARRWAHIRELRSECEATLDELLRHLGPVDLVLVEGYKAGRHPKIELRRQQAPAPPLADGDPTFVAIVADSPVAAGALPVIDRQNLTAIADCVLACPLLTPS